jgi:hypothetical protein
MAGGAADHAGEMNRIATLLAVTAVSAAALPVPLAGASSSSEGFVQKVNGICGDAVTQIDNLPTTSSSANDSSTRTLRSWDKISNRTASRLTKVKAPAYAHKRYKAMIGAMHESRQLAISVIPLARAGHTKAVEDALFKAVKDIQKFNDIAVDLNVGNCASITFPGYSDVAG